MKKNVPTLGVLLLAALWWWCSPAGPKNNPPVVSDIQADSTQINCNDTLHAAITASDPDRDTLSIIWSVQPANAGNFIGPINQPQIAWQAPASAQNCTLLVTVNDGNGGVVSRSRIIMVTSSSTPPPVVTILNPLPGAMIAGIGTDTIKALATHRNGIASVVFYFGAVDTVTVPGNLPEYSYVQDLDNLDGTYILTVKAYSVVNDSGTASVVVHVEGAHGFKK